MTSITCREELNSNMLSLGQLTQKRRSFILSVIYKTLGVK